MLNQLPVRWETKLTGNRGPNLPNLTRNRRSGRKPTRFLTKELNFGSKAQLLYQDHARPANRIVFLRKVENLLNLIKKGAGWLP